MQNITLNQKLRYRFDELMARGPSAQIAMLGLLSLALIVLTACIVLFAGLATVEEGAEPRASARSSGNRSCTRWTPAPWAAMPALGRSGS